MIQPAVMVVMTTPRRILIYFGKREVMSLAQEITLAERLVPISAMTQANPTKNAPARPDGPSFRCEGEGIPDIFAADDHGAGGGDDSEEAEDQLIEWQEENLPVDALFSLEVASEVRILVAIVVQPPVMDEREESISHERLAP